MSLDAFGGIMVDSPGELMVQSLVELPGTELTEHTELMLPAQAAFIPGPPTEITLDEDDVFQCGKCKKVFTSFQLFMFHKKEHQLSPTEPNFDLDDGITLSLNGDLDDDLAGDLDEAGLVDEDICLRDSVKSQLIPDPSCTQIPLQPHGEECLETGPGVQDTPDDALEYASLDDTDLVGLSSNISQSIMLGDSDSLSFSMEQGVLDITSTNQLSNSSFTPSVSGMPSSLVSAEKLIHQEDSNVSSNSTWLLSSKEDSNNLNFVTAGFGGDRTLFLGEKKFIVDDVKKISSSIGFNSDDLLPEVSFSTAKNVFLNDSSLNAEEVDDGDSEETEILQTSEFVLKNSIDYITSGDLLAEFGKVGSHELIEHEASESITVLEVEMPLLSQTSLETPLDDSSLIHSIISVNGQVSVEEQLELGDQLTLDEQSHVSCSIGEPIDADCVENGNVLVEEVIELPSSVSFNSRLRNIPRQKNISKSLNPGETSNLKARSRNSKATRAAKRSLASKVSETGLSPRRSSRRKSSNEESSWEPRALKLTCEICNKRFSKTFDLVQHMRSHTGEKPFQCIVCGRAFAQKSNVNKHLRTHKVWPKGVVTLPKIIMQKAKPSNKDDLGFNVDDSQDSESTNDSCAPSKSSDADCESDKNKSEEQCETSEINASVEEKEEGSQPEEDEEFIIDNSYLCQFCDVSFSSYFELKTHLKKHKDKKVFFCKQRGCKKTFPDLVSFVNHTKVHCSKEATYRCHVCEKTFKSLEEFGVHQYSHSAGKPVYKSRAGPMKCTECRSRFVSAEALDHHMMIATHNHPCPECNRVFTCERNLRRHLPSHNTALPFVCKECGKAFRTENYLNVHLTMHSEEKPFTCPHCPAKFARKDRLSRHELIHEASTRMKCPLQAHLNCQRQFTRRDKLKLHVKSHTEHEETNCSICLKEKLKFSSKRPRNRLFGHDNEVLFNTLKEDSNSHGKKNCSDSRKETKTTSKVVKRVLRKPRAGLKENEITGTPSNSSQDKECTNDSISDPSNDLRTENLPTIEILVMPLSLSLQKDLGVENCGIEIGESTDEETYKVLFPVTVADSSNPHGLTTVNETFLSHVDCDREGGINLLSTDQDVAVFYDL